MLKDQDSTFSGIYLLLFISYHSKTQACSHHTSNSPIIFFCSIHQLLRLIVQMLPNTNTYRKEVIVLYTSPVHGHNVTLCIIFSIDVTMVKWTHGTVHWTSILSALHAGHTHEHKQRWHHRSRHSLPQKNMNMCHECRSPSTAPGPPETQWVHP